MPQLFHHKLSLIMPMTAMWNKYQTNEYDIDD